MGFPSPRSVRHWLFFNGAAKVPDPLTEKLSVESDGRLLGSLSSSSVLGFALALVLASMPIMDTIELCRPCIPDVVVAKPEKPDRPFTVILQPQKNLRVLKRQPPQTKPEGRPAWSAAPKAEAGVLAAKVISTRTSQPGRTAYEILHAAGRDLAKLDGYAVIKREATTRYSGRPGRKSTEFNAEYDIKDLDGERNLADDLPGIQRIEAEPDAQPEMPRPSLSSSEIGIAHEYGKRSTSSILAVVKSRSPGLRHLYNQHLRQYPGLQGKVSVRFSIDARGMVVSAALEGSTTGLPAFDQAILAAVRSWHFEPVKHLGVEEVLVPLQFSE